MDKFNVVDSWISSVQYSHSKSVHTEKNYRRLLQIFSDFIEKTPQQILEEYDAMTDREFRRKYARYLRAFISYLDNGERTSASIASYIGAIRSFFKHNDLPLGYVPVGKLRIVYHNRDITKEEVAQILAHAKVRDKAYFCMMAQSGLRPCTLNSLRYEHIQKDFEADIIPLKVNVPAEIAKGQYRDYFTFAGPETVRFLKLYLKTRPHIKPSDYLFTHHSENRCFSPKSVSKTFRLIIHKLERHKVMKIKKRQYHKPAEVRLYNLRKFFRKYATPAGFEYVQFWMGHIVREGVDEHYRPKDPEFHRKLYAEKAMPFLRLETATPTETEEVIEELREQLKERDKEINVLEGKMAKLQPLVELVNSDDAPENLKRTLDFIIDGLTDRMRAPLKALVEEHFETLEGSKKKFKKLKERTKTK
ncbi:hypothetical protein E3J74_07070 [Candidatus Bathyarchaeota archaeon]|nr:MAG: hypothetical protein E3J74_07070 [Candidatus Bathyarchaeota archaeon]